MHNRTRAARSPFAALLGAIVALGLLGPASGGRHDDHAV